MRDMKATEIALIVGGANVTGSQGGGGTATVTNMVNGAVDAANAVGDAVDYVGGFISGFVKGFIAQA